MAAKDGFGLGPLEMQVLGLLEGHEPLSVSALQERLLRSHNDLAYTTVMTVLSRLHEKGLVTRKRDGKRYLYAVAGRASELTSGVVQRVHRALFKTARLGPIAALLDEDELSTDELRALRTLVNAKLKERGR